jgi:myosin heavy subunit
MSILHNLRLRYKEDLIYTSISSILISVNPFKLLPLYTPAMLEKYRNGARNLPPHVFGIAYQAYQSMLTDGTDQSVVISGESGAGKSEATKLILQFLTDVSARAQQSSGGVTSATTHLEQQILAANPILETFGNAKTLRNNNSSRFGKLITINFDSNGGIIGGGIINYLLEKSRVVTQTKGERNYHIFYQLLSNANTNQTLNDELKLNGAEMFSITNQSGVISIDGVSDVNEFADVLNSFQVLNFPPELQNEVFKIVAGVLHFGNITFKSVKSDSADDKAEISNPEIVAHASSLWGINAEEILKFLTAKSMIGGILVPYSVQQAIDTRDAMVKRVYADLFQVMVNKINTELQSGGVTANKFIGVLDIFGFESFEVNSFEQLCINYCNEKLQFHFNEHIFRMEQELYKAEGIVIAGSSFVDNQATLDLLDLKGIGVFSMSDEEINVPKGSDDGLLQKLLTKHADGKHSNFIRPKPKDCKDANKNFGILHYAGPVFYNISNFLEKNKDQLHSDIINVLRDSSTSIIRNIYASEDKSINNKKSAKKLTLGGQFKLQLNDLITTLNSTHPHFVRCMKSNDKKIGNFFAAGRMQDQLRYAGLVEVCRIRKLGFPVRRAFQEFYQRYKCMDLTSVDLDDLLKNLSNKGILTTDEWAKGQSKIFMRTNQSVQLELSREAAFTKVVLSVQKCARGFLAKIKIKHWITTMKNLQIAIDARQEVGLSKCLELFFELPWHGVHLLVFKNGKILLNRLKDENKVLNLLESSINSKDLSSLKSAIEAAALLTSFTSPLIATAQNILNILEAEIETKKLLQASITSRNINSLTDAIERATNINYSCSELQQAIGLKKRIIEENELLSQLLIASNSKNIDMIDDIVSKCAEIGIENRSEVVTAIKIKEDHIAEQLRIRLENERIEQEKQRLALEKLANEAEKEKQRQEQERIRLEQEKRDLEEKRIAEEKKKAAEAAFEKRQNVMKSASENITLAMSTNDAGEINEALQAAIQLGIDSEVVHQAQTMLTNLDIASDAASFIDSAIKVLEYKKDQGLVATDLADLQKALAKAWELKVPPHNMNDGQLACGIFNTHVKVTTAISKAIQCNDRIQLRSAIDQADNLDIQTDAYLTAKDALRELEAVYREDKASGAVVEDEEPYDEAEEARKARQELVRQPRFDYKNFPQLRTADDYAKGSILNKKQIKEQFLNWQMNSTPKSILDLKKEDSNASIQLHKNLLGYMCDKKMPFPAMLAQDILRKGFENKKLRDEIYVLIIKQLTNNPRLESIAKGWQIMCMCVGTFPPSYDFENFLLHFIIEKKDTCKGAIYDYTNYSLRTLEAMLINGDGTGFVPSVEEITAYTDRPPILATIYLVDGNIITEDLPLTPDLNVGKVIEMCVGWLEISDSRSQSLGMFVYDLGEEDENNVENFAYSDLLRTPRPLRNEDFLGDVIVQKARQKRIFKFVLKKKYFLPSENYTGTDPFFERIIYLQAEDECIIQGNIEIDDEDNVSQLAGISMAIAFGESLGTNVDELIEQSVTDFIPPSWRELKPAEEWSELILESRGMLVETEPETLQEQFLSVVQKSTLYGMLWFYTHKVKSNKKLPEELKSVPTDLLIAFNAEGLFIFSMDRVLLHTFSYGDIFRWGGSSSQFSLILNYKGMTEPWELTLITSQATDMAACILDHIRAIMAAKKK